MSSGSRSTDQSHRSHRHRTVSLIQRIVLRSGRHGPPWERCSRRGGRAGDRYFERLTRREREVLQALADGLNDQESADRLQISTKTARTHVVNILGKLEIDSLQQAVVLAVRRFPRPTTALILDRAGLVGAGA